MGNSESSIKSDKYSVEVKKKLKNKVIVENQLITTEVSKILSGYKCKDTLCDNIYKIERQVNSYLKSL